MSEQPPIVIKDENEGFGAIAWVFGLAFLVYAALIVRCVLTHWGRT